MGNPKQATSLAMSQQVKFPPTRLVEADYGPILASQQALRQLDTLLNGNSRFPARYEEPLMNRVQVKRARRAGSLKTELAHEIASLRRSVACQEQALIHAGASIKSLLTAARKDPASAAYVISSNTTSREHISVTRQWAKLKCAVGQDCGQVTLPFSRFCLQHQAKETSQVLYRSCTVVDTSSHTQCKQTVTNIFSSMPLCGRHSSLEVGSVLGRKKPAVHNIPSRPQPKKVRVVKVDKKTLNSSNHSKAPKTEVAKTPPPGKATSNISQSSEKGSKPVTPSKSLDDLLTLGSSLTAAVPKLDLLPLKADIGEIMMAGEDSSSDDNQT